MSGVLRCRRRLLAGAPASAGTVTAVDGTLVTLTTSEVFRGDVAEQVQVTAPSADLAELLSAELGRRVQYVDVPGEQFAETLQAAGLDAWTAAALTELHQLYRAHASELVTDEVHTATGRAPRSVADWLTDNKTSFTG